MRARLLIALVLVSVGVATFLAGRGSVRSAPVEAADRGYHAGFVAGREAAFCCYDGGWGYGEPYIVTLRRGARGVTYRIARRWPSLPGLEYRACGRAVCAGAKPGTEHVLP